MIHKISFHAFLNFFVTTAAIYDKLHNVASKVRALDVVTLRLRMLPRWPRLYTKLQNTQAQFDVSNEWTAKNCDSFRCVPNTHTICLQWQICDFISIQNSMTASLSPHLTVNGFMCIFFCRRFTKSREVTRVLSQSSRPILLKGTNLNGVNFDSSECYCGRV